MHVYKISQARRIEIWSLARQKGFSNDDIRNILFQITAQGTTSELNNIEAEKVIAKIKEGAK